MTKMTNMSKANVNAIAKEAEQVLSDYFKDRGINVRAGGGSYADTECKLRFQFSLQEVSDGNGNKVDARKAKFDSDAILVGLEPDDFGRKVTLKGQTFRVIGAKPNSPKNNVLIERVSDGKQFVCNARAVIRQRERDQSAA